MDEKTFGRRFRYQEILDNLTTACPPEDFEEKETVAYRWVFEQMEDSRNFEPQYVKNPKRFIHKPDSVKCIALGLSFFDSEVHAAKRFSYLQNRLPEWEWAQLGKNIAAGILKRENGVPGEINADGHFTFFIYEEIDLTSGFVIIASLKNNV